MLRRLCIRIIPVALAAAQAFQFAVTDMVISHKHRYLFIEIPMTGSYAIRYELLEHYGGESVLHKHATYQEFARTASAVEKSYFAFAAVRNPLDVLVSQFYKYASNHKNVFDDPEDALKKGQIDYPDILAYERCKNRSFAQEMKDSRVWRRPYSDLIEVSGPHLDHVLRHERLAKDFEAVLRRLGLDPIRPIPVENQTQSRRKDFISYYDAEIRPAVKRRCGPFMQKWGYAFPSEWGPHRVSRLQQLEFRAVSAMKRFYFERFRYNDRGYARAARRLHAGLKGVLY